MNKNKLIMVFLVLVGMAANLTANSWKNNLTEEQVNAWDEKMEIADLTTEQGYFMGLYKTNKGEYKVYIFNQKTKKNDVSEVYTDVQEAKVRFIELHNELTQELEEE